jgi:hypothetical protein
MLDSHDPPDDQFLAIQIVHDLHPAVKRRGTVIEQWRSRLGGVVTNSLEYHLNKWGKIALARDEIQPFLAATGRHAYTKWNGSPTPT